MIRDFAIVPPRKSAFVTLAALALLPLPVFAAIAAVQGVGALQPAWIFVVISAGLVAFVAVMSWSLRRMRVRLADGRITVRASGYRRRLALSALDLDAARILALDPSSEWWPRLRMNGIGLPGAAVGHFRASRWHRKLFCALTDRSRVLVLPERGADRALLFSVEKPQALLEALRRG